jgi:hypothetical protein
MPVANPVVKLTLQTGAVLLVQVPPVAIFDNDVDVPVHTALLPEIAGTTISTVTVFTARQPLGSTYETFVVPALMPLMIPVELPIIATEEFAEVHVPPITAFDIVVMDAGHINEEPEMPDGAGLTVITWVAVPDIVAYDIVAVPAVSPVTSPDGPTVHIAALLLLHTPPAGEPTNVAVLPLHKPPGPVIVWPVARVVISEKTKNNM